MTIEEMIKQAMGRMIERKLGVENVKVISWSEEFERGWYDGCDTCGYGADDDTYKVYITYTVLGGNNAKIARNSYTHTGSFAELLRELDNG